jgi:autotransporter-associated beta strand protein
MKRKIFNSKSLKQMALAVPAAALMLGAAQAGTTVGLNFQTWYYNSLNDPQTIGFNNGYSAYNTTGFPVTAKAFGVSPANWSNTDPMLGVNNSPIDQACKFGGVSTNFAGSLSCYVNSPRGGFQSGSGCMLASGITYPSYAPGVFCPQGEDELLWGIIVGDDANPFSVSVFGLAAKFPSGYVIQSMAAHGGYSTWTSLPSVDFTDGATTYTAAYHIKVVQNASVAQWPTTTVGISDPSGVFTADTIYINSRADGTGLDSSLAGLIITDQPVVTSTQPAATKVTVGNPFTLTGSAMGLGTLSYQWNHNGTGIPSATNATYTVEHAAAAADNGNYQLVVTSDLYPSAPATGDVVTVSVTSQMTFETYTASSDADTSWVMTDADFSVNFGGDDTDFGGVIFTGTGAAGPQTTATKGTYTASHNTGTPGAWANIEHIFYGSGTPLLTDGTWTGGYGQIDISGLTVGHVYKAKFIVADTRSGQSGRQINIQAVGAAGASGFIQFAYPSGEYAVITATFLAKATTASFYPEGNGFGTQINGFQIKDIFTAPVVPPLVWDNGAGNGIWSTTDTNWSGSAWPSGSTSSSASFGATGAGPVTLGEPITVQDINFSAPGYSISGNTLTLNDSAINTPADVTISSTLAATGPWSKVGSGQLTLNGVNDTSGGIAITAGTLRVGSGGTAGSLGSGPVANGGTIVFNRSDDFTYSGPMSGTGSLVKNGNNKLTLDGAISYSGTTLVNAGTVEVLGRSGDAPYVVTNGATLKIGYSTGGGYANTGLQLYGDGTSATTGWYIKGGTTYNVAGTPTLLGAPTTIRQYGTGLAGLGVFDVNATGLHCTAAASGSIVDANIALVQYGYGVSATIDAGANTATGDLILNGPLSVATGPGGGSWGFWKKGTGSVRLNAVAATANCELNILAGSAICGIANCIGANAVLKVPAAGTLNLNGFSQTVTNATLVGIVKMRIVTGGTPTNDVLTTTDSATPTVLDGTLIVTATGTAPKIDDKFALFNSAGSYTGGFTNFNLPYFAGLSWDTSQLAVDGSITVITSSIPPSITVDLPTGTTTLYAGGTFTLKVVAAGDPILHYQWKRGTTPVGTDSATLTLTPVTTADTGDYSVTVTNDFGSAPSGTHHLEVLPATGYAGAVMQDAPLGYWPLNELAPATAYDYSSEKNGTQEGTPALGVDGPKPLAFKGFPANTTAYQLNGIDADVNCGTAPALSGTTDFTLEAWVNTTATTVGYLMSQRSGFDGEYMFLMNANGTVHFTVYGGGGYQFDFSTTRAVNDGQWHHVAAVRSGGSGYIYIDGTLAGQGSGTVRPLDPTFTVGFGKDFRDNGSYFNGTLCNVAIYSKALTGSRVKDHYNMAKYNSVTDIPPTIVSSPVSRTAFVGLAAQFTVSAVGTSPLNYKWIKNNTTVIGSATTETLTLPSVALADSGNTYLAIVTNLFGSATSSVATLTVVAPSPYEAIVSSSRPVAYWPLYETAGPVADDVWGGHQGTYLGNVTYGVAGPTVTGSIGVGLDGVNPTAMTVPYSADLNPAVFSVEGWFNPVNSNANCVVSCGQFASPRSGWLIYQGNGAGWNLRTYIGTSTTTAVNLTAGPVLTFGTWQHVAATWDGTTGRLYVNGVLAGSQVPTSTPAYMPGQSGGFAVGRRADDSFWWPGQAADVALYNHVLTPQEIQSHALNRPLVVLTPFGGGYILTWPAGTGGLQAAPNVTGTYTNVPSATSPWTITPTESRLFYRIGK